MVSRLGLRVLISSLLFVPVLLGAVEVAARTAATPTSSQTTSQQETATTAARRAELADLLARAEKGDADAQNLLGRYHASGQGVPKDYSQAVAWWRKAADQGKAAAQYNLGAMYFTGQGVVQDYVEAHKWRNLAAALASSENQQEYADTRDAVAKSMTPEQLAEAQKRASEWMAAFEKGRIK